MIDNKYSEFKDILICWSHKEIGHKNGAIRSNTWELRIYILTWTKMMSFLQHNFKGFKGILSLNTSNNLFLKSDIS